MSSPSPGVNSNGNGSGGNGSGASSSQGSVGSLSDGSIAAGASSSSSRSTSAGSSAGSSAPAGSDAAVEGGAGGGCSSLPLCDNFDTDTAGKAPNASLWTLILGCNAANTSNSSGSTLSIGVVNTKSHSPPNSVQVNGGDSCGFYFVNTSAFASLGSQVYGRFWASFSGAPTMNHNGFMSMYTGTDPNFLMNYANGGDQLRLGFQGGVVVWNDKTTDATLPDIDSQGEAQSVMTASDNWDCFEFHVDQTTGYIEFWFDGAATTTPGLSYSGTATQGVSSTWSTGGPKSYTFKSFGLGWLFLNNDYTVWFDDVALGNSRIGCN